MMAGIGVLLTECRRMAACRGFVVLILATIFFEYGYAAAPRFTSTNQELVVFEGETVEIKCSVTDLQYAQQTVFWLNNTIVLSRARDVFYEPRRLSIEGDDRDGTFNLKIRDVRSSDDGVYSCQVPPAVQANRLIVSKPPSIDQVVPSSSVEVDRNDLLTLECRASGRPDPSVIWTRKDKKMMPTGRPSEEGQILMIDNVQRSAGGTYICTADNGIGSPASRSITVSVRYGPVINVTSENVYTGPGHTATIECIVQANPNATVSWYHNSSGSSINFRNRRNIKQGKEKISNSTYKWTLEFSPVQPQDLGLYRCEGSNTLDTAYGVIVLSPFPYNLKFFSPEISPYREQYTLQWTVMSHSPLLNFSLFLKQINDTYDTPWIQFSIPASEVSRLPKHSQEYVLSGLAPDSKYKATMRARNMYGDSTMSEEFMFRTAFGIMQAVVHPLTVILSLLCVGFLQHLQL